MAGYTGGISGASCRRDNTYREKLNMYDIILFDLDGTLTDPGLGITNAVMHALKRYGLAIPPREELYSFIGPPLWEMFQEYCHFSKEEAEQAVEYYREYYRETGIFENRVYDGIRELLIQLQEAGKSIYLATSKPEVFARRILEHFDLAKYFTVITGCELDGHRVKKAEVIEYALEQGKVTDFTKAVMIGDREHDIFGAKQVGIDSIGVLFGYGSEEELKKAGADYIAPDPKTIGEIIMGAS